jgi:hypothetical protein
LSSTAWTCDLQINLLTEQKVSKVLQVLHGQARGPASSSAVHDSEVADFAKPADPEAMLTAIKKRDQER